MRARAFCPGHVTGFFEVKRSEDLLSSGSRGAGLCISLGATTDIEAADSRKKTLEVHVNGEQRRAYTTVHTLNRLLGERDMEVVASTRLDLPESQGFGMSAAGALSAGFALCDLLGIDAECAFEAAHSAEIECATGLGDVSSIRCGGLVIREAAGLPPRGRTRRMEGCPEIVLAVIGSSLRTAGMIGDPDLIIRVNREGSWRVDELAREPSISKLMMLSASFALDTGLASREVRYAMASASSAGLASMAMLGNSIFAIGSTDELVSALSKHGRTYTCRVDTEGVRMVQK
ncbi:MAG: hypothetical protein JSV94_02185 [Methanobacteriota archaeon]|nr:MAG: hypothetical protein JSV94_02185 [Euryarchaeota archaeon]